MTEILNKADNFKKIQNLPIISTAGSALNEKKEKHLRELVECEFNNQEEPGMSLEFTYGNASNKHKFKFFHGGAYSVPRFIQRHVESLGTPQWGYAPDGSGGMQKTQKGKKHRFTMREVYN